MVSRFLFIRSVLFHCALLIHLLHLRSCSLCCVFFSRTLAGFCSLAHSFTSFSFGYVSNSDFFPLFPILRLPFVGLPRLSLSLSLSLLFPIFPLPLPSPFPFLHPRGTSEPFPPPTWQRRPVVVVCRVRDAPRCVWSFGGSASGPEGRGR